MIVGLVQEQAKGGPNKSTHREKSYSISVRARAQKTTSTHCNKIRVVDGRD